MSFWERFAIGLRNIADSISIFISTGMGVLFLHFGHVVFRPFLLGKEYVTPEIIAADLIIAACIAYGLWMADLARGSAEDKRKFWRIRFAKAFMNGAGLKALTEVFQGWLA